MITYTVTEYLQSRDSLEAKILAIESLIDAMLINTIDTVGDSGTMSYSLDDGQMKVTTNYRSSSEITNGILKLEKLLQIYINRLDGNITFLRGRLNY